MSNSLYQSRHLKRHQIVSILYCWIEGNLKDVECFWELDFDEEMMELIAKIYFPNHFPVICSLVSFRKCYIIKKQNGFNLLHVFERT